MKKKQNQLPNLYNKGKIDKLQAIYGKQKDIQNKKKQNQSVINQKEQQLEEQKDSPKINIAEKINNSHIAEEQKGSLEISIIQKINNTNITEEQRESQLSEQQAEEQRESQFIGQQLQLEGIKDIEEINIMQKCMFDEYFYQFKENNNLNSINNGEQNNEEFEAFKNLIEPNEKLSSPEVILQSNQLKEQASANDDLFFMKVLNLGLQQEGVELRLNETISITEQICIAELCNGEYGQKKIIDMRIQDSQQMNFQKLSKSMIETEKFIQAFKESIMQGFNTIHLKEPIQKNDVKIMQIKQGSIQVLYVIQDKKGAAREVTENEAEAIAKHSGITNYELKTKAQVCQRGGLVYNQPDQWKRYGIRVLGKYKNEEGEIDDSWLNDWGVNGWAVAYHGFSETRGINRTNEQKKVNFGINSIIQNGFVPGSGQQYKGYPDIKTGNPLTEGVYFSNQVKDAERYCNFIEISVNNQYNCLFVLEDPNNYYKIAFTCRINPKAIQFATNSYYVVSNRKDIRPYGILLKKYPKNYY